VHVKYLHIVSHTTAHVTIITCYEEFSLNSTIIFMVIKPPVTWKHILFAEIFAAVLSDGDLVQEPSCAMTNTIVTNHQLLQLSQ